MTPTQQFGLLLLTLVAVVAVGFVATEYFRNKRRTNSRRYVARVWNYLHYSL